MTKKKKPTKSPKKPDYFKDLYGDTCDDRFAYIAGYTSGGAPYGSTWEEMGIDPSLPSEEKVTLLGSGDFQLVESDDFPFGNPEEEVDTLVIDVIPEKFSVCKVADYSEIDIDQPFVFPVGQMQRNLWSVRRGLSRKTQSTVKTDGGHSVLSVNWTFHWWVFWRILRIY